MVCLILPSPVAFLGSPLPMHMIHMLHGRRPPSLGFLFEGPDVPNECCVAESNDFTETARSAPLTHSQENYKKEAAEVSCRMARQLAHLVHVLRTLADVRWAQLRPTILLLETRESSSHANLFLSEMIAPTRVLLEAKKKCSACTPHCHS